MKFFYKRPSPHRNTFAVFHNLDVPHEEVAYISMHILKASFLVLWMRTCRT